MKISFEIVPRSAEAFAEQYAFAQSLGASISLINVPDIQRFDIRSWETGKVVDRNLHGFIPHFRAIDFDLKNGEIYRIIEQHELDHVLLVTGDPPEGLKRSYHNTSVVDLIREVKKRYPRLEVYAGFDSHRSGVQDEINYTLRKADAGASGFFSQPFYDMRMIEIYAEQMQDLNTFIGLSPITTESSMHYWEVKNQVQFPRDFRPDYDWNVEFSNRVIRYAAEVDMNLYFMPIRIKLDKYFGRLSLPQTL